MVKLGHLLYHGVTQNVKSPGHCSREPYLPSRKQLPIPLEITVSMVDIRKAYFWILWSPHTQQMT